MAQTQMIQTILRDSAYHLGLFSHDEIAALSERVLTKLVRNRETPFVRCIVRDKDIQLNGRDCPSALSDGCLWLPKKRLAFEHAVHFGREEKRADIVIFDKDRVDSLH